MWTHRKRFRQGPNLIFTCPVLHKELDGTKAVFRWEFCAQVMKGIAEEKARTHVASHISPEEYIKEVGVMRYEV